jgi:Kef-type K+ transport system membrane component KefB/voltage-gated potassium channel Kch
MHEHLLQDIGVCIIAATVLSYVARLAKQPLLLAYIAAGVVIGPVGFKWIGEPGTVETLAKLGLAFLLFIVGLELELHKLIESGRVAVVTTVVQVVGCGLAGWGTALALGYGGLPAVYIGAAVAFSSTMIVVKLLADMGELNTISGRTTLGVLLVQDALAVVVLAIQPNLGGGLGGAAALKMVESVGMGVVLTAGTLLVSRYVLPWLLKFAAHSPEILLISAISWCFLICYAAIRAGFSEAMGALLAGVSISTLPYSLEVVAKLRSLRDFFVTLFFVSLGMLIVVPTAKVIVATLVLSVLVVLSRFVTVLPMLRLQKLGTRIGVLSSLHLGQVSEFGLVIVLLGVSLNHVDAQITSLVVLTLVVSSTMSTYLIQFSHKIASLLVRQADQSILRDRHTGGMATSEPAPIVLVGCFRLGSSLANDLIRAKADFAVIDFNPVTVAELKRRGVKAAFGDISHRDTLEHAGIETAKVVISPIADDFLRGTSNLKLLQAIRRINPQARVIVRAESIRDALTLYEAGADYVLIPRISLATELGGILALVKDDKLDERRAREIEELRTRNEVVE